MAYYPSSIKNDFTTKVNFVTTVGAADVNDLQGEVTALESYLGTSINVGSGWVGTFDNITTAWPTLKARLANLEYGLNNALNSAVPTGGTAGQTLVKNSSTNYDFAWATSSGTSLPSQTGQSGNYLTTDGTSASWAAVQATFSPFLLIGA